MVAFGDNLQVLKQLPDNSFKVIYIDPPFNTGIVQKRQSITTVRSENGDRIGYKGNSYDTIKGLEYSYNDSFDEYWEFLAPRIEQAWRLLAEDGTFYLHLDYREVHYAKILLDQIFGPECFVNEIIWAYDYGAKSKKKWPAKHDNILVYVKNPEKYFFNENAAKSYSYNMPGEKENNLPIDVWWHTIVSPNGKEKTGYPTQKPLGILKRIIETSSKEGEWVLDFFGGSGTTGAAAAELNRKFFLIDKNPQSLQVMKSRFSNYENLKLEYFEI